MATAIIEYHRPHIIGDPVPLSLCVFAVHSVFAAVNVQAFFIIGYPILDYSNMIRLATVRMT